ncbi:hypothetical protein RB653_008223 [Dictyostelium firmibasis]|uniref:(d)CMP kinase n=1 Tax=Dictyostelium firmibasis TaxID=79012 RepID=A0AAN7YQZ3_9MYCE
MNLNKISKAYIDYFGKNAIVDLKSIIEKNFVNGSSIPNILIGGTQLTGKSTMGKKIANHFSRGKFYSVGGFFREAAKSMNISIAEQSKYLRIIQENKDQLLVEETLKKLGGKRLDIEMDYKTCQIIAGINGLKKQEEEEEENYKYLVIEGRQPATMGYFTESLGRKDLIKIYVTCSSRERAIRFIGREIGEQYAKEADKYLSKSSEKINEPLSKLSYEISKLPIPNIDFIVKEFEKNQNRDEDDRQRYIPTYFQNGKKQKQNRPVPQWIRLRTDNTIRYNNKRRHWRRTKLGI